MLNHLTFVKNHLLSLQGYYYLFSLLRNPSISRLNLEHILNSMMPELENASSANSSLFDKLLEKRNLKKRRKFDQFHSMSALVAGLGEYKSILELNCGNGMLLAGMAAMLPSTIFYGVDINEKLIAKAKMKYDLPNLDFYVHDIYQGQPDGNYGLVYSLHGCGNLTDLVIDIAVSLNSDVVIIPCCYAKIKRKENQPGSIFLPRSNVLEAHASEFRGVILSTAKRLEGSGIEGNNTARSAYLSLARLIVNLDRVFYLQSNGYQVSLFQLTGEKSGFDQDYHSSGLRLGLVGRKV